MSTTTPHQKMMIPRRPFGSALNNPNLPATVPILSLGCSSFSTFFWTKDEVELSSASSSSSWTCDQLDRNHEIVREWIATIHYCTDHGMTLWDTAPWYGHGTSEVVVGWALEELVGRGVERKDLCINTKVGRYEADPTQQFDFSREMVLKSVKRSLTRLKTEYIDVLQLHDPEFAPSLSQLMDETIPAMLECRKQGWCRALGMTGYPLEVQHQLLQVTLEKFPDQATKIWDQALTYGHFNLHNTSLLTRPIDPTSGTDISYGDYIDSQGMGLLAAAPLSMGLLTHSKPPNWHPASEKLEQACQVAADYASQHKVNLATVAILFAMSDPRIPSTILGIKDRDQAKQAVEMANRFDAIDTTKITRDEVLAKILTDDEHQVVQYLLKSDQSPFHGLEATGDFRWDGVACVREFWKQVETVQDQKWQVSIK